MKLTEEKVWALMEEVKDPEIPVLSIKKMGIVRKVAVSEDGHVEVAIVPTFAGCPAIEYMQKDIEKTLRKAGADSVEVKVFFKSEWSTNEITDEGREVLKDFGLSPPPKYEGEADLEVLGYAQCPVCDSTDTTLKSRFGPTACRPSIIATIATRLLNR
jgi:ring-1,2-phenylacetyl-CoA epoxidase subunit PaaD